MYNHIYSRCEGSSPGKFKLAQGSKLTTFWSQAQTDYSWKWVSLENIIILELGELAVLLQKMTYNLRGQIKSQGNRLSLCFFSQIWWNSWRWNVCPQVGHSLSLINQRQSIWTDWMPACTQCYAMQLPFVVHQNQIFMWQPKARQVSCITNLRTVIQPIEWKRQIAECQNSKDIAHTCCNVPVLLFAQLRCWPKSRYGWEKNELKFRFLTCTLRFRCNLSTYTPLLRPRCFNQLTIALNQVCLLFFKL